MHKLLITLGLIFGLLFLMFFTQSCSDQNPLMVSEKSNFQSNHEKPDVQRCANYHNAEVARLKILDKETGCLSENLLRDFRATLQEMARRNPAMAANQKQVQHSQAMLEILVRIQNTGHHYLEINRLLQLCFYEFKKRAETNSLVINNLEEALSLLISRDAPLLTEKLNQLKLLTDELGSAEEIGVVGVFLGSLERSLSKRYEDPNLPWWWRWVIISDVAGSLAGGPSVGAMFSAWAELFFIEMNPPGGHY